jgi:tRNA threonylcarbamoyladenosine biosynthesis protein TsaE
LSDVNELGDDVFAPDSVTAIEWGEAVRELLGETYLDMEIAITPTSAEPDARTVTIQAYGDAWTGRHDDLQTVCAPFATR